MEIPVKYIDIDGTEKYHTVETNLIDLEVDDEKFISSLQYVPDFQRDTGVFKDASKLLDRLVTDTEDADLKEINQAYCDTIYKWSAYNKLSYGAKITMLQEKGFDYVLDLLLHMYDDEYNGVKTIYDNLNNGKLKISDVNPNILGEYITIPLDKLQLISFENYVAKNPSMPESALEASYNSLSLVFENLINGILPIEEVNPTYFEKDYITLNGNVNIISYDDFVKENADESLTKLTALFNLINSLKGKTLGLELVLNCIDMPSFFFLPWNIIVNSQGEWGGSIDELPLDNYMVQNGENLPVDSEALKNGAELKKVKAGLGFTKTVNDNVNHFIFNGVSWHACSNFDDYSTPREPLTAILDVYGASSTSLQKHLNNFVRAYMLPLINVTIRFTATMPIVYAYPSGVFDIYNELIMEDYDDLDGHHQQNLIHKLSDEHWYDDSFKRQQLCFGVPEFEENGFQGTVNLSKSYVQDLDGVRHSLYGSEATIASILSGNAIDKIDKTTGLITNYDGTHLQAPLDRYIEIDIETGEQQNPHYVDEVFVRDSLIKYYKCLTIEGIHLAKTVEQMEELLIEDFEREFSTIEVYLGMETKLACESGRDYTTNIESVLEKKKEEHNAELLALGIPQTAIDSYIEQYILSKTSETEYKRYMAQSEVNGLLEEYYSGIYENLMSILNDLKAFPVTKCDNPTNANQTLKDCLKKYDNALWRGKNILSIREYNELAGIREEVAKCEDIEVVRADYTKVVELLDILLEKPVKDNVKKTSVANTNLLEFNTTYAKWKRDKNSLTAPEYYEVLGIIEEIKTYQKFAQYKHLDVLSDITPFYEFTCNEPQLRSDVGVENIHLKFCEATLDECYTGIGDLGILGANDYFIYNGMLMYHGDTILQVGEDKTWTDVGASHAVSETYFTPAINNGKLVGLKEGNIYPINRSEFLDAYLSYLIEHPQIVVDFLNLDKTVEEVDEELIRTYIESWTELSEYWDDAESNWSVVTGYINEFYTAFGICEGRLYKIYLQEGILLYEIMDDEQGWTYITGAAYSETYEAYGIKNGKLYKISADGVTEIVRQDNLKISGVEHVTITETESSETVEKEVDGEIVEEVINYLTQKFTFDAFNQRDTLELVYQVTTYEGSEYVSKNLVKVLYNGVDEGKITENLNYNFLTKNTKIIYSDYNYTLNSINITGINYVADFLFEEGELSSYEFVENDDLIGWDDSFDCISRYHHCNSDYTTYGICNGDLYSICNETITKLDNTKTWTAICGFYNENSPRTFAYAIADGKLYELKGNTFELKDETMYWTEIHGCTTATNNFVLGIGKSSVSEPGGYLYKINAKTLSKLDTSNTWTKCFGRYTTSTSTSNVCYGYGVKNNKLYQITKDGISIVSGFWKKEWLDQSDVIYTKIENVETFDYATPNGRDVISVTISQKEGIGEIKYISKIIFNEEVYNEPTNINNVYRAGDLAIYFNQTISKIVVDTDNYYAEITSSTIFMREKQPIVDLIDYDITELTVNLPDGTQVTGIQNIKEIAPVQNTVQEDYDIYVTYTTRGFENNTRYIVRTELEETNFIYIHPEECRQQVSEANCEGLFDTDTGVMTDFTKLEYYCADTEIHPLILDADSRTGIFYGYIGGDINKYGLILRKEISGNLVDEIILESNLNELKKITVKYNGDVSITTDNTFRKVFTGTSTDKVYTPKYLGGNGTIFGNGAFYLAKSYYIKDGEKIYLFENGKYFSLNTIKQDLVEVLITKDTQGISKVIEIIKDDNEILEFSMDTLYTQMIPSSTTLSVTTDYNINEIKSDKYEGITYATLTYSGAYELDPDKISCNTTLDDTKCHFSINGIAENLNGSIKKHFRLSTDFTQPIYIKSGSVVDSQYFFRTEENDAYTNKYLLESEVTVESDVACDAIPKGIVYELNSDEPKTVSRTLTYNGERFDIDPEKVEEYDKYYFDSYNTILTFYPQYDYIETEDEEGIHYEQEYKDAYAIIHLDSESEVTNGYMNIENKIKIHSNTVDQKFMTIDEIEYTTREEGDYYYKFNIKKKFDRLNTDLITPYNPVTEEKDKLQYADGQCWNFSNVGYHKLADISSYNGFILCVITDDDASKDQGIFGSPNRAGFGIKDNMWTYTDNNGIAHKSSVIVKDNAMKYIAFRKEENIWNIYLSDNNRDWEVLFTNYPMGLNNNIGYASVDGEMLAFNGTIDLAQSRIEDTNDRLFLMDQTTTVSISTDDETWEELDTFHTLHNVSTITMGHEFTGNIDCYYSKLLKSYELGWVYNRIAIDTAIKNEIKAKDPSYVPSADEYYDITEYGIYLTEEPKRWDTLTVTYTTKDVAFYMKPNKEYIVGMNVVDDHSSGKYSVDIVKNPSWNNGIFSNFDNGYVTYNFTNGFVVFSLILNGDNQGIACYDDTSDDTPPSIFIQNGVIKYFDNETTKDLFTPTQNKIYLKLYTNYTEDKEIEYSYDGENWISTNVAANFSGYEKFAIGKAYIDGIESRFQGSLNVEESFYNNGTPTNLFQYYKKIIPYIIEDGVQYPLTNEPLLTIRDYVIFASAFNGSIDMYKSDLVLPNTRYWEANQIKVYENINGEKGALIDTVIRDAVEIESDKYITESSKVKVNPADLQVYFPEIPSIKDVIVLTYNTWYMFREKETKYNFKITYENDLARISYKKDGDYPEYTLYITENQNMVVNTGYQFNGTFVVKDSTRSGMKLTYPDTWNTYVIKYRKADSEEWYIWDRFIMEKTSLMYQRMGYDLLGTHYLPTSRLKTESVETPFVSFYNNRFIRPVGSVSFAPDQSGIVSNFSEDGYLEVIMTELCEGWKVFFWVTTGENENQGLCTWVRGENGYFISNNEKKLNKFRKNYTYIVQFKFGDEGLTVHKVDVMRVSKLEETLIRMFASDQNKITVRILGYNLGDNPYTPQKPLVKTVTIIPYNPNKREEDTGHYITSEEQASRVKVSYRKIENRYDHLTEEGIDTWYPAELEKMTIKYGWKDLEVYAVKVPFGYAQGLSKNNNMDYYTGEMIEFKVKSEVTTYNSICPYNDMTMLQRAIF